MDSSRATSRTSILDPDNISIRDDDRYDHILEEERIRKEDDELKRLSKYFEQSREELQKVDNFNKLIKEFLHFYLKFKES